MPCERGVTPTLEQIYQVVEGVPSVGKQQSTGKRHAFLDLRGSIVAYHEVVQTNDKIVSRVSGLGIVAVILGLCMVALGALTIAILPLAIVFFGLAGFLIGYGMRIGYGAQRLHIRTDLKTIIASHVALQGFFADSRVNNNTHTTADNTQALALQAETPQADTSLTPVHA